MYADYITYSKCVELYFGLNANSNCGITTIVSLVDFKEVIATEQSIDYTKLVNLLLEMANHDFDHFFQISDFGFIVNYHSLQLGLDFTRSLPEEYRNFILYTVIAVVIPYLVEDFCSIVANDTLFGSDHTEASDSEPGCPTFADDPLKCAVSCGYWRHLYYSFIMI